MYIPKKYGKSRVDKCPFCGQQATTLNSQKLPVCTSHKNTQLNDLKCACGSYLEIKHGKFGVFFVCINCGNINLTKALELNSCQSERKVITVRSDDPLYFD
ncbi:MAG: hypothetical protein ABIG95_02935 [Candidatus Woesearchaeota archaeon]